MPASYSALLLSSDSTWYASCICWNLLLASSARAGSAPAPPPLAILSGCHLCVAVRGSSCHALFPHAGQWHIYTPKRLFVMLPTAGSRSVRYSSTHHGEAVVGGADLGSGGARLHAEHRVVRLTVMRLHPPSPSSRSSRCGGLRCVRLYPNGMN